MSFPTCVRERGEALVATAHPDFRLELLRDLARIRSFNLSQRGEAATNEGDPR